MRQLWLSSPSLGGCIPNLGHFKASDNLAKIENLAKPLYGPRDHPLGHLRNNMNYSVIGIINIKRTYLYCFR